ncbi:MAG: HI0074 family nucleotidyltransferase substrate-binding subunit [Halobacteriovoraceae bacterium]|nr:HI0074 family nucleotidyltransferase substrate-binding subunit [Halobacteriovoraceae bacterium]
MSKKNERWVQRLEKYEKALCQLEEGIKEASERELSDLEKSGIIQRFKCTFELAINVIRDFYIHVGNGDIQGSKDAFEMAFNRNLITKGDDLLDSIKDRNLTLHTYNENIADEVFRNIVDRHYDAFEELKEAFIKEKKKEGCRCSA